MFILIFVFLKFSEVPAPLFKILHTLLAERLNLLYYTRVRWLSKGNVLARVLNRQKS